MFDNYNALDQITLLYGARKSQYFIYWIILILVIFTVAALPFMYFDISINSVGIIRPSQERTEIKSMQSGIISQIYYKNGDFVKQGSVILQIRDNSSGPKEILNNYELAERTKYIHDLDLLTQNLEIRSTLIKDLMSPVYKQQASRFIYQKAEHESSLKKARKELQIDSVLSIDRIIAPKEMFDKIIETEKLQAAYEAFKNEQVNIWQQELAKCRLELSQFNAQRANLIEEQSLYSVKAPVSGIFQEINTRYAGGFLQAGEPFCTISPEANLVAECYVPANEAGFISQNQEAKFKVDAFDYNYFGVLTGKITSIDNDYTIIDNKPMFKVRCELNSSQLNLRNGFVGNLKKGLTLQARFIVARRNLWQLLWDKVDNWLDPASPTKNNSLD